MQNLQKHIKKTKKKIKIFKDFYLTEIKTAEKMLWKIRWS